MNINLTLIGQTIMFAMFVWFCMKFIWPPLVEAMAARKKAIEDGLKAAELGKEEHALAQKNAEELIESSKTQAAEIIANADKQASVMIDNAKGAASEEADKIKAQAKSELDQEVAKARNELRTRESVLIRLLFIAILKLFCASISVSSFCLFVYQTKINVLLKLTKAPYNAEKTKPLMA